MHVIESHVPEEVPVDTDMLWMDAVTVLRVSQLVRCGRGRGSRSSRYSCTIPSTPYCAVAVAVYVVSAVL
jgi:hypothetical protein